MKKSDLLDMLKKNQVPESWYSLDDGLKMDAFVIIENYSCWEFFYLDEKGDRQDFHLFSREEEAYDYLWSKIDYDLRVFRGKK